MRFVYLKLLFLLFVLTSGRLALSSQDRALGTWKLFMPYGNSLGVFDAGDRVYSAAEKSIFSYEKNSGVIQVYDKASGLNDIGIKTANYDPETKALLIAYVNSNLDLIFDGTDVYNIPDIKNKAVTGAISINSISFFKGKAYISSDIGISVIDLSKKEISNTYVVGASGNEVAVYATSLNDSFIYAATAEGLKYAPVSSPNLQNFNNWSLYGLSDGLPQKRTTFVATFNDKVYAVIGANNCDTLFEFNGSNWGSIYFDSLHIFTSLNVTNSCLYFSAWSIKDNSGKIGKIESSGNVLVVDALHPRPESWFDTDDLSWEADLWSGLLKNSGGNIERIVPDGPGNSNVRDIEIADDVLYIATGGADESWNPQPTDDGFFVYKENRWKSYNKYTNYELDTFQSVLTVTVPTGSSKAYWGSYLDGVAELDLNNQSLKIYNKNNTSTNGLRNTLEATQQTSDTRISALTSDANGNIWICNAGGSKPLKLLSVNGGWKEFAIPYSFQVMKKMLIDKRGQLWAPVRRSGEGLLVWSDNNTPDEPSDDLSRLLLSGQGSGGLPDASVNCIVEDKEGNIWAGTNQGIGIFYCPGSVLTSTGCDADQVKVERDGYIGYLFGSESVRSIAVDAANKKWIGTTNGLWLISADGKEELLKFNSENSPLPSNQITDIAIDKTTGEVFIGTTNGLASYQGDAIADCADCDKALVYPNPVKPDYTGPIAIKGLTDEAYVKITDVSGTLIFQGKANGCQMVWDGKGYNGTRAKSGVYLVFSSTDLGKEKRVAKILVTN